MSEEENTLSGIKINGTPEQQVVRMVNAPDQVFEGVYLERCWTAPVWQGGQV